MWKFYKVEKEIGNKIVTVNMQGSDIKTYKDVLKNSKDNVIKINDWEVSKFNEDIEEYRQYYTDKEGNIVTIYLNTKLDHTPKLNKKGEKTYSVHVDYFKEKEIILKNGESIFRKGLILYSKATQKTIDKIIKKGI